MVSHPSEYPWSSYHTNALGKEDHCVVPHKQYLQLGVSQIERQKAYRALFKSHITWKTLEDIRECTNRGWVLGNDRFKEKIQKQLNCRTQPLARGGDRKSKDYKEKCKINRV